MNIYFNPNHKFFQITMSDEQKKYTPGQATIEDLPSSHNQSNLNTASFNDHRHNTTTIQAAASNSNITDTTHPMPSTATSPINSAPSNTGKQRIKLTARMSTGGKGYLQKCK